jgi:large subunit ribosomal protein L29
MGTKAMKEVKKLSKDELTAKARGLEADLFQLKMKKATGQLEKSSDMWKARKQLARVKTLETQLQNKAGK